jgi:hypothetical protein
MSVDRCKEFDDDAVLILEVDSRATARTREARTSGHIGPVENRGAAPAAK